MTNWFDNVPAPMSADGEIVPLGTKKLYASDGEELDVEFIGFNGRWVVKFGKGDLFNLDWFHVSEPDSWERLLEDLDRAADASGNSRCACSYLTGDADTECDDCRFNEDARWCVRIMAADVARRIRALREADNAD